MKTLLAATFLAFATVSPVLACLKAPDSSSACAAAPAAQPAAKPQPKPAIGAPKSGATAAPARTAPAHLLM